MSLFTIRRVLQLPTQIEPSTMYILKKGQDPFAEVYFSNSAGTELIPGITESFITNKFQSLIGAGIGQFHVVDTIAERDALEKPRNVFIMVVDATGDEFGTTGSALYLYRASSQTYFRVSVFDNTGDAESDIPRWDIIQGRPNSEPAAIDAAVEQAHSHTNKQDLDRLSIGEDGGICVDGRTVANVVNLLGEW